MSLCLSVCLSLSVILSLSGPPSFHHLSLYTQSIPSLSDKCFNKSSSLSSELVVSGHTWDGRKWKQHCQQRSQLRGVQSGALGHTPGRSKPVGHSCTGQSLHGGGGGGWQTKHLPTGPLLLYR